MLDGNTVFLLGLSTEERTIIPKTRESTPLLGSNKSRVDTDA